jgi:hypothetical protein
VSVFFFGLLMSTHCRCACWCIVVFIVNVKELGGVSVLVYVPGL